MKSQINFYIYCAIYIRNVNVSSHFNEIKQSNIGGHKDYAKSKQNNTGSFFFQSEIESFNFNFLKMLGLFSMKTEHE